MIEEIFKKTEPKYLWQHFLALTKIARPSGQEQQAAEYIKNWAKSNQFTVKQDQVGNLVVQVPATPGQENKAVIILQGHLDMVCERDSDSLYNAEEGRIKLILEEDWLKTDGTTLGADNGIGVAAALAVAEDPKVIRGPLELLFTVDEEVGLVGARGVSKDFITGQTLLNLDSEEDYLLCVGCAGGHDLKIDFSGQRQPLLLDEACLEIKISGLKGGHSGIDINRGRLNAIKILVQLLQLAVPVCLLVEINGGNKRNAIPREASVVVAVPKKIQGDVIENLKRLQTILVKQVGNYENNFSLNIDLVKAEKAFTEEDSTRLLSFLRVLPAGVISMSQEIQGLVQTSTNLGVVSTQNDMVEIFSLIRSSLANEAEEVVCVQENLAKLARLKTIRLGSYPGWQPNLSSKVLQLTKSVYKELFATEPELAAVHAGLECGLFAENFPELDMVSFGPLILGAHSPVERVSLTSVNKFWSLLTRVLAKAG